MNVAVILTTWARDALLNSLIASKLVPRGLRGPLLRGVGLEVAPSARVSAGCFFGSRRISIGSGSFINYACFFDGGADITIGQDVALGYQVMLVNSSHRIGRAHRRAGEAFSDRIIIEDGVWIGARAVVLPGVRIAQGVVIAAGAVVANDCKENGLYAGVPARRVREL